jgi:holo-[acyl-carrier protein] synthase
VIGVGIDAVEVGRFRALLERRPLVTNRLFTDGELSAVSRRADPVPGLAARFAAKEAAMKALSTGLGGIDFADVEVVTGPNGEPRLAVSGRAADRAAALGVEAFLVSLSHTDSLATAVVIAG